MHTLNEYLDTLTVSEHTRMIKVFVEGVPISRTGLYAVRRGDSYASMASSLRFYELSKGKVDPRSITKPGEVWEQLDAYYKARQEVKVVKARKRVDRFA